MELAINQQLFPGLHARKIGIGNNIEAIFVLHAIENPHWQ